MVESIQLHLNSEDCIKQYSGTAYIEFALPFFSVASTSTLYASVVHANIPYSFYNINSTNNCLCYILGLSTTINRVYIPLGNYTSTTLLTQLISILPTSFTITYNVTTNTFTFTNLSTFSFQYDKIISFSTCLGLLGFTNTTQTASLNVTTYTLTSNTLVNLAPVRCICIYTTLHTGSLTSLAPLNQNILCSIPISTSPFTMISYHNTNSYKANLNTNVFNNITIKLTDQLGNILNLNNVH